jgi:hypothetical protein
VSEVGGASWDHSESSALSNEIAKFDCGASSWRTGCSAGRVLNMVICIAAVTRCQ